MKLKYIILLSGILGLVGCGSILGPQKKRQTQLYQIVDNEASVQQLNACSSVLDDSDMYVSAPDVVLPYNDYKMYYTVESYMLSSYSYSQWAIPVSSMIHQAILQRLTGACIFNSVNSSSTVVSADYRLLTSVRLLRHELNEASNQYNAHIIIANELVKTRNNEIINSYIYDSKLPTDGTPTGFVKTVSSLVTDYDGKIISWLDQATVSTHNSKK